MNSQSFSNFGKWMALTAALLGWLFDGLEMGLFPLVQRPALRELLATTTADGTLIPVSEAEVNRWIGIITAFFLIGAATGGVLFGWLGDRIGRVRSMMLSVITYALVSAMCGFANEAWQVGVLRFIAALGMGGEWSLGVALINEIWPARSRAFLAGLIGAAANVGYLIIALAGLGLIKQVGQVRGLLESMSLPGHWIESLLANDGWRFLMMLGALPALLTFFIRMFVPESEKWLHEKEKGATSYWATHDLFSVLGGAAAACGIIALWAFDAVPIPLAIIGSVVGFVLVTIGYIYPVMRYLQRVRAAAGTGPVTVTNNPLKLMLLAACLSGIALLGTWGSTQQAPAIANKMVSDARTAEAKAKGVDEKQLDPAPPAASYTQLSTAAGAVIGTILAALIGNWLGRRITYFLLCISSFAILQLFLLTIHEFGDLFLVVAFFAGAITASFYGWLPLYLPELFPTAIRATGQGFGFNFGRVIAAIGVLQLGNLSTAIGGLPQACAALSFIYFAGMVVIWFVPETKGQPLPD